MVYHVDHVKAQGVGCGVNWKIMRVTKKSIGADKASIVLPSASARACLRCSQLQEALSGCLEPTCGILIVVLLPASIEGV